MNDRQQAALWAHELTQRDDWCVIDTETTGFSRDAEIVQLAIVGHDESVLLETLVKPTVVIDPKAEAVHGLSQAMLASAPSFDTVLVPMLQAVGHRDVLIYNAEYDLRLLRQSVRPYGMQLAFPTSDRRQCRVFINGGSIHCAMNWYTRYLGKKAKLPGGDHSAVGDCRAVVRIIREMAASYEPELDSRIPGIEPVLGLL